MNLSFLSSSLLCIANTQPGTLISNFENVLGTSLEIKIKAANKFAAESAEKALLLFIQDLQNKLGAANIGQGLHDFNQTFQTPTQVSTELKEVLQLFIDWQENTSNAIHPSTYQLTKLWQQAEAAQVFPSQETLDAVVEEIKNAPYEINPDGTVTKLTTDELRLHSLAKGYVLEKAADFAMNQADVSGVVINLGGDITAKGDITESVKITDPFNPAENAPSLGVVTLQNQSLASSGNYKQGFTFGETSYSHIFDPNTALPVQEIVHSSVIHQNAVTAGALATAFNILPTDKTRALADRFDQSAYLLIDQHNQQFTSENWSITPETSASTISFVNQKEKAWNPNLELQINLQLADLGGYARRPYVAVWIEDENHQPVRRLAIWYRKPRWLPDLREFSSTLRQVPFDITSITSATRSAGQYSLVWDGKNDAGQWVPQGNYTVFIEAAREHGTYQLIKQKITCDDKSKQVNMPGNEEVASSSLALKSK